MIITAIELYHVSVPLKETFWPTWIPEFREGFIDPIIPDKDGMLYPFTKPGPGFEIRKDWLCKYGKRFFMNAPLCQSGRRRARTLRPPTPPYIRFRIRRFMGYIGT